MEWESTYRLISPSNPEMVGRTAATRELAMLAAGDLVHCRDQRLGLEQTDWAEEYGKPKARRTVLIDAESAPNEWILGT